MGTPPSFSIVIPVYRDASALEHLLSQFDRLLSGHLIDVIVVEGSSDTQDCEQICVRHGARYLKSKLGRSHQMNTGAAEATGDYIWFLHADTQLPITIADSLREAHKSQAEWGFFRIALDGSQRIFRVIETAIFLRSKLTQVATGDQGIFIKRDLWLSQVKCYADIPLMEDVELSKRLRSFSKPLVLTSRLTTSSRRWKEHGVLSTIFLMWALRLKYWLGVSPSKLAKQYYPGIDNCSERTGGVSQSDLPQVERSSTEEKSPAVLIQMARYPELGKVKTRLSSVFDEKDCLELHKMMLERNLAELQDTLWDYQLWLTGNNLSSDYLSSLANRYPVSLHRQIGDDLGGRMLNASQSALKTSEKVVIVGSDCPYIDRAYIRRMLDQLSAGVDVVFAPASDGGYVAVAFSKENSALFSGINWGTSQVLEESERAIRAAGLFSVRLPVLEDVDHPEDLIAYYQTPDGRARLSEITLSPVAKLMLDAAAN